MAETTDNMLEPSVLNEKRVKNFLQSQKSKIAPETVLREIDTIIVFQCENCKNNYFSPPTRCKNKGCNSIRFQRIETERVHKEKIYSGF